MLHGFLTPQLQREGGGGGGEWKKTWLGTLPIRTGLATSSLQLQFQILIMGKHAACRCGGGGCKQAVLETNKQKFWFEPKQTKTRSVSVVFWFFSWNQKPKFLVCFGVSNLYRNNRNKQNCFEKTETNLNFLKNTKYALYQTVLVGLLFVSVQSKHRNILFR